MLNHKNAVISDIVHLLALLSQLKFDRIRCLSSGNKIGSRMDDGTG